MPDLPDCPSELSGRWRQVLILKRDLFSTIERGRFVSPEGEVDAVLRRIDGVPWWILPVAHWLFRRERRALAIVDRLGITPPLLYAGRRVLVRGWISGVTLHAAKPHGNREYFRRAKAALRTLHRAGLCHNDLAKEQNWLCAADGRAIILDFQLATQFRRRHGLFRLAAYEDLRHLLKHKFRYVPDATTAAERRVLARKSVIANAVMAVGKPLYLLVTRGMLNYADREGVGRRFKVDAPALERRLKTCPDVRAVAIVAYPDHRKGVGLYAFVEAGEDFSEQSLRDFLSQAQGPQPPENVQIVDVLPRNAQGEVRREILQLVAMNQIDQIESLTTSEAERIAIDRIVAGRRNLRDRISLY